MKTPITDAAAQTITIDCDDSCVSIYVYESDKIYEGELVPAFVARRLELDRAALMEALESITKDFTTFRQIASENGVFGTWGVLSLRQSEAALATARANFPTE
jgi:hypothetical protein